jgi:hypothetical protein
MRVLWGHFVVLPVVLLRSTELNLYSLERCVASGEAGEACLFLALSPVSHFPCV